MFDTEYTRAYALSMSTEKLKLGDSVKVSSGIYQGVHGTVSDIQDECSVVRIKDTNGENVYALLETVVKEG